MHGNYVQRGGGAYGRDFMILKQDSRPKASIISGIIGLQQVKFTTTNWLGQNNNSMPWVIFYF